MSRLQKITVEQATGHTAEVYGAIKKALGGVPNLFQSVGVNSSVLQTYLGIGPSLKLLSGAEQETVALITSQANQCDYCLAAHTVLGKMHGLKKEETLEIRQGRGSQSQQQALVSFTFEAIQKQGKISDETLNNLRQAGYTDAHIPEILMVIAATTFTNFFNSINQTEIDFPAAEKI